MAWMTTLCAFQCDAPDLIADTLIELAGRESLRKPQFGGAPSPLSVTPAKGDFLVVSGIGEHFADTQQTAAAIADSCGVTGIVAELVGNSYRLRCSQVAANAETSEQVSPRGLTFDATEQWRGPMPAYDDVEQLAYRALRSFGVPRELILATCDPLGAERCHNIGEGIAIDLAEPTARKTPQGFSTPQLDGDDAPVVVARSAHASPAMRPNLIEHRYIEGAPSVEAVKRLVAIEGAIVQRAQSAIGGPVDMTFFYHAGAKQDALNGVLRALGRPLLESPRSATAPWWQFWRYFGKLK